MIIYKDAKVRQGGTLLQAHARPSAQSPIDMSGNLQAHMSEKSPSNISPNPTEVISEVLEP